MPAQDGHSQEGAAGAGYVGRHPTLAECEAAGVGKMRDADGNVRVVGLPDTPEERARFEAYMRGHCWGVGGYEEVAHHYDTMMVRMLYGVWRDRGGLPTVGGPA